MYVKIHNSQNSQVIAICDEDLIGKILESKTITLKVSEYFYKGESLQEGDIIPLIKTAKNVNILGKKSIAFALKNKIIKKEDIIKIKNVPHAQIYA